VNKVFIIPREELYEEYIVKKKSISIIAKEKGCSQWVILDRFRRYGIKTRTISEALKLKEKKHPNQYTREEEEILKKYYATAPKETLLSLLPNRSWDSIRVKASKMGLRRPRIALKGEKHPFYGKHHTEEALRKIMASLRRRPNRAEQKLDRLIKTVTDEFEYNGDFRLGISIGGKIPDWINCNGKKMVIELLGHGWHKPNKWFKVPYSKTEEAIRAHYDKYGWKCLCIWDTELKTKKRW